MKPSSQPFARPFPWAEAIGFGFGVLRLAPEAFWRMTPRELAHAIVAVRGRSVTPIERCDLDELMRRFPDTDPRGNSHGR